MAVLREVVECRLLNQIRWTERIERKGENHKWLY